MVVTWLEVLVTAADLNSVVGSRLTCLLTSLPLLPTVLSPTRSNNLKLRLRRDALMKLSRGCAPQNFNAKSTSSDRLSLMGNSSANVYEYLTRKLLKSSAFREQQQQLKRAILKQV